ncbi:MAG TPA: polymer-forming cytoskeletal protein [Candidatus Limnocylindrales bacterium]|nr:polymer-forming cytoskeletal protein [Candidatus Limnocylindrales bacterium]
MRPHRLLPISIVLAALLALLTTGIVLAQGNDLGGKVLGGSDVTIPAGTVDHDVYAFGGRVTSNATINGELVVAGGTVTVNGPVQGDVIVTGGQLTLGGQVGGHVRAAGGQIAINGNVAKDVLAAGGQVTIGATSTVGGDLIVQAGQLQLDGTVTGSSTGTAGAYAKNGSVGGSDGIEVNPNRQGTPIVAPANPVLDAIRHFVAVVLIGALLIWLWPRAFRAAEASVRERPAPAFGWGIVAFVGYFVLLILIGVVGVLLAIAFAALGFGALLGIDVFAMLVSWAGVSLAFVVAVAFVVDAIVGVALARAVLMRSGTAWGGTAADRWSDLLPLLVGAAVVVILSSLPVVGWLVKLIVMLLGLGAIVFALWRRTPPPTTVPVTPQP